MDFKLKEAEMKKDYEQKADYRFIDSKAPVD
jgi:hypothetical protein